MNEKPWRSFDVFVRMLCTYKCIVWDTLYVAQEYSLVQQNVFFKTRAPQHGLFHKSAANATRNELCGKYKSITRMFVALKSFTVRNVFVNASGKAAMVMMITAMVERWNKDEERKKKKHTPYEKCDACAQLRAPGSFHLLCMCRCLLQSTNKFGARCLHVHFTNTAAK